jgi:hypothetical protein
LVRKNSVPNFVPSRFGVDFFIGDALLTSLASAPQLGKNFDQMICRFPPNGAGVAKIRRFQRLGARDRGALSA